jgi:nucleoside phosphorylase
MITDQELLQRLDRLKGVMVAVATGGPRIGEVQADFARDYDEFATELARRQLENPLPYRDLWEWYGRWSSGDMPSWQSRRKFVNDLVGEFVRKVRAQQTDQTPIEPTGWVRVDQNATREWVGAAEAIQRLRPIMDAYVAQKTICARAHSGLIRARAERFIVDNKVADGHEVPREFWWAEGEAALQQNWTTGDFDTWIDHSVHLKAFGVSFWYGDIEKMIPAVPVTEAVAGPPKASRAAIVLTALNVERRAVLRHLSDIREETVRGTVFHVGWFDEWVVAVAECGEGNVHAAATVERGIVHFRAEIALFVGVAGGVKDVSIGDAVVSSKVYGYERGKDTGDGFKPRPVVHLSAYALEQRARAIKLGEDWRKRLNTNLPHTNPQIHIGAIAAGEKVVAASAGKIAEFLKENYGDTLGVEMEGQGFLAGVHINAPVQGCVVRGISDLLDGKADADKAGSQEQAADVASAVAFEMLFTLQPQAADTRGQSPDIRHEKNAEERRTEIARTYFSPELARIVARQVHVLGQAVANFITASVGKHALPGDSWVSLRPWQPILYPNAAEFRNLLAEDATLLVNFYDSLQEITDIVNNFIDNQTIADVNAWNVLMQKVQHNLGVGQKAVQKFCPEIPYDAIVPAAGTLLYQSERAISGAQSALAAHLSRHGVS